MPLVLKCLNILNMAIMLILLRRKHINNAIGFELPHLTQDIRLSHSYNVYKQVHLHYVV